MLRLIARGFVSNGFPFQFTFFFYQSLLSLCWDLFETFHFQFREMVLGLALGLGKKKKKTYINATLNDAKKLKWLSKNETDNFLIIVELTSRKE